jgi:hypothetical protein
MPVSRGEGSAPSDEQSRAQGHDKGDEEGAHLVSLRVHAESDVSLDAAMTGVDQVIMSRAHVQERPRHLSDAGHAPSTIDESRAHAVVDMG